MAGISEMIAMEPKRDLRLMWNYHDELYWIVAGIPTDPPSEPIL
jgi:hypothetical protein